MAKKCGVFVISNKLFFHRHFTLFLDYNPVGLHAYVGVLLTVNHWFLSLQYAFARVRRFHALLLNIFPIFPFSHFPSGKWCFHISYYISIYYLFYYIYFSLYGKMGKWENGNFGKNALSFPLSCHLLKVYICHASCHSICRIYKNRVVKFAVVCLSENV